MPGKKEQKDLRRQRKQAEREYIEDQFRQYVDDGDSGSALSTRKQLEALRAQHATQVQKHDRYAKGFVGCTVMLAVWWLLRMVRLDIDAAFRLCLVALSPAVLIGLSYLVGFLTRVPRQDRAGQTFLLMMPLWGYPPFRLFNTLLVAHEAFAVAALIDGGSFSVELAQESVSVFKLGTLVFVPFGLGLVAAIIVGLLLPGSVADSGVLGTQGQLYLLYFQCGGSVLWFIYYVVAMLAF